MAAKHAVFRGIFLGALAFLANLRCSADFQLWKMCVAELRQPWFIWLIMCAVSCFMRGIALLAFAALCESREVLGVVGGCRFILPRTRWWSAGSIESWFVSMASMSEM